MIPKRIFIVPYRNRIQHKFFFLQQMAFLLEDITDYEIYFSHPCDNRAFNRGATRNIGFLAVKQKYPTDYQNMTFIFNDIDTLPFYKLFDYDTTFGIVKHYYGYTYALGGIVVIKGKDFEKINGYPCYWGWGMEDNTLQKRCQRFGLKIDRSVFFKIGSPEILQLFDGISRIISRNDPWRSNTDKGTDGIITIHKLQFSIDKASLNPNDNVYVPKRNQETTINEKTFYINILSFLTETPYESQAYHSYDLREPKRKILHPNASMSLPVQPLQLLQPLQSQQSQQSQQFQQKQINEQDWTKIPYYPTIKERREQMAEDYIRQGNSVPVSLMKQLQMDKIKEIQTDVYNRNIVSLHASSPPSLIVRPNIQQTHIQIQNRRSGYSALDMLRKK